MIVFRLDEPLPRTWYADDISETPPCRFCCDSAFCVCVCFFFLYHLLQHGRSSLNCTFPAPTSNFIFSFFFEAVANADIHINLSNAIYFTNKPYNWNTNVFENFTSRIFPWLCAIRSHEIPTYVCHAPSSMMHLA